MTEERFQALAKSHGMNALDQGEHTFHNQFLDFEQVGASRANPVRDGKQHEVRQSQP